MPGLSLRDPQSHLRRLSVHVWLAAALLLCASPALPQTSSPDAVGVAARQSPGTVNGSIVDDSGAAVAGATITLSQDDVAPAREVRSQADGQFSLSNVPPGPFRLTVSAAGFADRTVEGAVTAGDISNLAPIRLTLAVGTVVVDVAPTRFELAEQQIKEQEQQRLLGFFPNFFVTYDPNAVPLTAGQKFELSWKSHVDPVRFGVVAIVAGVQQARNDFSGFGQGIEGYARRYGAAYANIMTQSLIVQVLMPSLFKQDPRYFYKGTGSTRGRIAYAISRAVIKKGDNGHWQPNYSGILGSLASGAISNFYYPSEDRRGVRLTLENAAIGIVGAAGGYLAQELLFDKWTSRARKSKGGSTKPPTP